MQLKEYGTKHANLMLWSGLYLSMSKTMKCHSYCSCVLMCEPGTIRIYEAGMMLAW